MIKIKLLSCCETCEHLEVRTDLNGITRIHSGKETLGYIGSNYIEISCSHEEICGKRLECNDNWLNISHQK